MERVCKLQKGMNRYHTGGYGGVGLGDIQLLSEAYKACPQLHPNTDMSSNSSLT
jgi:hypothetical protein